MSPALLLVAAIGAAPSAELLDFTAEWCGPCQQMKPVVERLQQKGYPIRQVDVDRNRELAQRYNITGIPAFVLVVDGREVARKVGAQSESTLVQLFDHVPRGDGGSATSPPDKKKRRWFPISWGDEEQSASEPPPNFDMDASVRAQSQDDGHQSATAGPVAPSAAQDPIQTAVRLRVKDPRGIDFGSGTIIGSKNGEALVLTCWHIFRDFGESATVEVDLFLKGPGQPPLTLPGKMIKGNSNADVALVLVKGSDLLPVSPIASTDRFPAVGDHVFSVGCGEGRTPTKLQHTVTRLNPYEGPGTTECTGMPIRGRSGGGLFDVNGNVIGVCFAADREDERGVYAGPDEIHELIASAGFAALIPSPGDNQIAQPEPPFSDPGFDVPQTEATTVAAVEPPTEPAMDASAALAATATATENAARDALEPVSGASEALLAALDAGTDVEATVILRPRNRPEAPSEVIVINKVSDRFRRYLKGELDVPPVETGFRLESSCRTVERSASMGDAACRLEPRPIPEVTRRERGVALLRQVFDNHR